MKKIGLIFFFVLLAGCNTAQGSDPSIEETNPNDSVMNTNQNSDDLSIENSTPIPNQYSPKPDDDQKIRGPFFIDTSNLNIMESYPIQVSLSVQGSLPTPCHEFRVEVSQPDDNNQIQVDVYSVLDPEKICAQVVTPFEFTIPMGSFPSGSYSVLINGNLIGEFDS